MGAGKVNRNAWIDRLANDLAALERELAAIRQAEDQPQQAVAPGMSPKDQPLGDISPARATRLELDQRMTESE